MVNILRHGGLGGQSGIGIDRFFFAVLHALSVHLQEKLKYLIILDNYNKYDTIQIFIITNDS